ncbi:hypothetical protein U1Q18_026846 [Sarracenia purpurea var. burkii]
MGGWDHRSSIQDRYPYKPQTEIPSFSSSLLDAIYRSIDGAGEGEEEEEQVVLCRETMRKKQSNFDVKGSGVGGGRGGFDDVADMAGLRRACMIEKWMERKVSEKVLIRRNSVADFETKSRNTLFLNSSSSSSDSSSGGGFSSSEAGSIYGVSSFSRPKPIRTSVSSTQPEKLFNKRGSELKVFENCRQEKNYSSSHQKPKHENGFVKTKSKAMKIYGDLKKVKQPISPGGRLASFLNSIFTSGTAKKAKINSSPTAAAAAANGSCGDTTSETAKSKSVPAYASACSSASSFSRSCLSKTPSSRPKLSNGTKRSVRFYPVSVIVDEDSRPCGHKSLEAAVVRNSINEELKLRIMEKNQRVEEVARDLLKNYQKKVEYDRFSMRNARGFENDDDDDAASCASSDLFELDNLSAIGIARYREELPVYETTRLDTNRAIANGLIS